MTRYVTTRALHDAGLTARADDVPQANEAIAQFEAMVLQSAFAPVANALGFYGDVVLGSVMRSALTGRPR
jgi:hypothetical protein